MPRTAEPAPSRSSSTTVLGRLMVVPITALLALGPGPGAALAAPADPVQAGPASQAAQPGGPVQATVAAATTAEAIAAETLTWTASNSITEYTSAPATAVAGPTTIVFENSRATGNTIGMSHTLTFDTTTPGYNHDVPLYILANPLDAQGGRYEEEVTLTPGTYRYFCDIPGHGQMVGELVVTGGGGGGEEDTTAPTVTAEVTGEQGEDGSFTGAATVSLDAADEGSGVASVEYAIDGAGYQAYGEPVVVDEPGEHTVTYRATDAAGNVSEVGSTTFTVAAATGEDTTAPVVTAEVTGEQGEDGSYTGSATVALDATDEGSGVAVVEYELDGAGFVPYTEPVVISEPGMHMMSYRATDGAGNTSEAGELMLVVSAPGGEEDTTAPVVTPEITGEQDEDGAYVGSATISLDATDEGSGVASVEYALDGGDYQAYDGTVVVDAVGEHTMTYRATDAAGNVSEEGSVTFDVAAPQESDTQAPVVLAEVLGDRDDDGSYVGEATLTLTGVDESPGDVVVEHRLDGGPWVVYDEPLVVGDFGAHTVTYRGTDASGNVSAEGSVSFFVIAEGPEDATAPEVTASLVGSRDARGRYMGRGAVSLNAQDDGSGVALVEYRLDDGPWQRYVAPLVVVAAGQHTVAHRATDLKGNTSVVGSTTFTVLELRRDYCPGSDVRPTVVIGAHDSTVANIDTGDGCTINDLVAEDGGYESHQRFVRHVRLVTGDLAESRTISWSERRRIVEAALLSDVAR